MEQALTHSGRPSPFPVASRSPLAAADHQAETGHDTGGQAAAATPASPAACGADVPGAAVNGGSGGDGLQEETPGRSPLPTVLARPLGAREASPRDRVTGARDPVAPAVLMGGSDPLGEGLGLLAGIAIGLLTLVVPLVSVITDRPVRQGLQVQTPLGGGHQP